MDDPSGRINAWPATSNCGHRNAWAVRSGNDGATAITEAAQRYEPNKKTIRGIVFPAIECTASNSRANASRRANATVRLPGSRSGLQAQRFHRARHPATEALEWLRPGKGECGHESICAARFLLQRPALIAGEDEPGMLVIGIAGAQQGLRVARLVGAVGPDLRLERDAGIGADPLPR